MIESLKKSIYIDNIQLEIDELRKDLLDDISMEKIKENNFSYTDVMRILIILCRLASEMELRDSA